MKLIYLSIILVIMTLSSCTNDQPVVEQQQTTQSVSARTAMNELKMHFNSDGTLSRTSNDDQTDNPTGNILFDYCFDFEYPVTFSYNTGTTVTINDFNSLIDVLVNMTDTLYINGVEFPFNVSVFNEANGAVEIQTITNESEFETLINSCGFEQDDCICPQDYSPICVEVQDPNGDTFVVQFPNMCYAQCEGFTQNDIVACGDSVEDPGVEGNDCFDFDYPISIIGYDGTTMQVASDQDWEIVMYTMNGNFDFVYPYAVTLLSDNGTQTISNDNDYITLLTNCYDDVDPCDCDDVIDTVCIELPNGGSTVTYDNFCLAMCDGYTQNDIVDCGSTGNDACWEFVAYPVTVNVNGVEQTVADANELNNFLADPSANVTPVYPFDVTQDGVTLNIQSPNYFFEIGEWDNMCE